jgi:hypothetical protein
VIFHVRGDGSPIERRHEKRRRPHHGSVHAIAKTRRKTVSEANEAIERWADSTITDKTKKHTLALELARLDELQELFYQRALEDDVQCGAMVTKIIERQYTDIRMFAIEGVSQ